MQQETVQRFFIWSQNSAVFTCIGALGTPLAERGPSLESIYRVSLTVDFCIFAKVIR